MSEFSVAQGYAVKSLAKEDVLAALEHVDANHAASTARFAMILKCDVSFVGHFYLVTHNSGKVNVAHISPDGSIACTCEECFDMASPCRHVWSLFRHGHWAFNAIAHLHPIFHSLPSLELTNTFDDFTALPPTALLKEMLCMPRPGASCFAAVDATEELWLEFGLGANHSKVLIKEQRERKLTAGQDRAQRGRKMFHEMLSVMTKDVGLFQEFCALYNKFQEGRVREVGLQFKARQTALNVNLQQPLCQNQSSKKRKTAGSS